MPDQLITAVEMATANGIDPKRFRAALRAARLGWHSQNGRWEVMRGSSQHADMENVMARLCRGPSSFRSVKKPTGTRPRVLSRDEHYVLDLCDEILGLSAVRQHCFPFVTGDPDQRGYRKPLPVDGYYPELSLVVEYHERQHSERVGFFDDKPTVSGVSRGEQRRRYDARRRELLPMNGITLIVLGVDEFAHDKAKRLLRISSDMDIVSRRLQEFQPKSGSG